MRTSGGDRSEEFRLESLHAAHTARRYLLNVNTS